MRRLQSFQDVNKLSESEAGGSLRLRPRVGATSVASWNGPALRPDEVRDDGRGRRVEADDVEHSAVGRICDGEAVRGHPHDDGLRLRHERAAIIAEGLRRMHLAGPRLAVGVGHKRDGESRRPVPPKPYACRCGAGLVDSTCSGRKAIRLEDENKSPLSAKTPIAMSVLVSPVSSPGTMARLLESSL